LGEPVVIRKLKDLPLRLGHPIERSPDYRPNPTPLGDIRGLFGGRRQTDRPPKGHQPLEIALRPIGSAWGEPDELRPP
jgi:hypothetical protein